MKEYLLKINENNDLSFDEMKSAIQMVMTGQIDQSEIESFLLGLNKKGISEDEITAAASVMKEKSLKFDIGASKAKCSLSSMSICCSLTIKGSPIPILYTSSFSLL